MDRNAATDTAGTVIPFPATRHAAHRPAASSAPKRRALPDRRAAADRRPVEELLDSLKGRRGRLEDRLALISLAIEKLEDQVLTKRNLEILPGIS